MAEYLDRELRADAVEAFMDESHVLDCEHEDAFVLGYLTAYKALSEDVLPIPGEPEPFGDPRVNVHIGINNYRKLKALREQE